MDRLQTISERKHIDRIENVEELLRIARGLAKSMIERSAARAAHFVNHAVEHHAALLVLIKSFVQEMAQKAATLGDSPSIGEPDAAHRVGVACRVFQETDEIPRPG